ncbi:hypothetical protein ABIB94_008099 [Bradyrhizobium sp. JR7.2]|uniref:TIR domain-containing protein n=1 Tax=unclassified Bradyrhizobium TaxID=2631580 RepID=UPI00339405CD
MTGDKSNIVLDLDDDDLARDHGGGDGARLIERISMDGEQRLAVLDDREGLGDRHFGLLRVESPDEASEPHVQPKNRGAGKQYFQPRIIVQDFQPFGSLAPPRLPVAPLKAPVKRKAFFSFHYDDIMRVNVVRNAWKIDHPDNALMRSFQDSSLWESRKLEGDEAVKRLIREGVEYTSAVCVLIGTDTWVRRWVRYEIARAIVDGRGLLGVHLNSIRHHHTKTAHTRGYNPLDFMAVGKVQEDIWTQARYCLFEKQAWPNGIGGYRWAWNRYSDYTSSVTLPPWLADPAAGYVTPLSQYATVYDYIADDGHKNIGSWIDKAAQGAGR